MERGHGEDPTVVQVVSGSRAVHGVQMENDTSYCGICDGASHTPKELEECREAYRACRPWTKQ